MGKTFRSEDEINQMEGRVIDNAISPETVKNKPFTKADDIWALGCFAYTLAAR